MTNLLQIFVRFHQHPRQHLPLQELKKKIGGRAKKVEREDFDLIEFEGMVLREGEGGGANVANLLLAKGRKGKRRDGINLQLHHCQRHLRLLLHLKMQLTMKS